MDSRPGSGLHGPCNPRLKRLCAGPDGNEGRRHASGHRSLDWVPSEARTLYAGLGLLDAKYTAIRQESPLTTRTQPVRTPDATGHLGASYTIPLARLHGRMTVGGDVAFTGSHWVSASNTPASTEVDSHWLVQAQVAYESAGGDWTANLSCRNCVDDEYVTSWFIGLYVGDPHTWELRLGHRFN